MIGIINNRNILLADRATVAVEDWDLPASRLRRRLLFRKRLLKFLLSAKTAIFPQQTTYKYDNGAGAEKN